MNPVGFKFMQVFLKERSGLILNDDKAYLLESRLTPVARRHAFAGGLDELIATAQSGASEQLLTDIVEAMTTNESFFFRDTKPFDLFKNFVLPHLLEVRGSTKSFRIWSAAASSGQEPYSLGMILKEEAAKLPGWRHKIIGTDLSKEILAKAEAGRYSQFEVQRGMPIQLLVKYFDKDGESWQIKPAVKEMIEFKPQNLLKDFSLLGKFDVVFCRNVLIYFDQETKSNILDRISAIIADDGYLFLGGAETVLGLTEKFGPVPGQRGIYKKLV